MNRRTSKAVAAGLGMIALSATVAFEGDAVAADGAWPELGLQVHYAQWEGPYSSYGTGGRFRWEPLAWLGVEGTLEAVLTDGTAGSRIDIPIGAQIYVPWELTTGFRTRAIAGVCGLLSKSRGATPTSTDADDVQVGFKAGAGFELALGGGWSAFTDLMWQRYVGHSRQVSVWSNALDGELVAVDRMTFALGLGVGL